MAVYINFQNVPEGVVEDSIGPFQWIQLTYRTLIVATPQHPDGEEIAWNTENGWEVDEGLEKQFGEKRTYTDVLIHDTPPV